MQDGRGQVRCRPGANVGFPSRSPLQRQFPVGASCAKRAVQTSVESISRPSRRGHHVWAGRCERAKLRAVQGQLPHAVARLLYLRRSVIGIGETSGSGTKRIKVY